MKMIKLFVLTLAAAGLLAACDKSDKKSSKIKVRKVMTVLPLNRQESAVKNFTGVVKENSRREATLSKHRHS